MLTTQTVLHAISTRYALHLPYTYSGIVLVRMSSLTPTMNTDQSSGRAQPFQSLIHLSVYHSRIPWLM